MYIGLLYFLKLVGIARIDKLAERHTLTNNLGYRSVTD